jgi:hypothetical protein
LVSIGLVVSEEKIFEKVYDRRQVMAKAHLASDQVNKKKSLASLGLYTNILIPLTNWLFS